MRTLALLSFALLVGCKTTPKDAPAAGSGSAAPKVLPTPIDAAAAASSEPPVSNVLKLPKGPGTPPVKTTGKLEKAKLDAATKLEFPGFKQDTAKVEDGIFETRIRTIERPKISITTVARPCGKADCLPMDLAKWKATTGSLKQSLPPVLRNLLDTKFEVGAIDVHGATAIYTYQIGQFFGKDENGQPQSSYTDAYTLFWNDGVNRMTVIAQYADDPLGTQQMMTNVAPKEDLEKIAVAFLDVYSHAWH